MHFIYLYVILSNVKIFKNYLKEFFFSTTLFAFLITKYGKNKNSQMFCRFKMINLIFHNY